MGRPVRMRAIFEAVKLGLDNVLKAAGDVEGDLFHEFGMEHMADAHAAPSIVWELVGSRHIEMISGPRAPTAVRLTRRPPNTPPAPNEEQGRIDEPNELARRDEVVDVHVQAGDYDQVEILMGHFVAVARIALTGFSFKVLQTSWPKNQKTTANVCVVTIQVAVPFAFEPMGIVRTPVGLSLTGEFEDPS